MEPDLFSYTYSGETKHIVSEFIQEVGITLRWITSLAMAAGSLRDGDDQEQQKQEEQVNFESELKSKAKAEKEKVK